MSRAIEKDLFILLPTLSSTGLPPELVQLANSLLAQSRSKATTLKPDEEIARGFCCAHIASERLKIKLDLPDIQIRPPCSKKIYNKLFAYLSSALSAKTSRPSHANSAIGTPSTPTKRKRIEQETPTRSGVTNEKIAIRHGKSTPATPSSNRPRPRNSKVQSNPILGDNDPIRQGTADENFPPWITKVIRRVCKSRAVPELVPHVFAALSATVQQLLSKNLSTQSVDLEGSFELPTNALPPLVIVVLAKVIVDYDMVSKSLQQESVTAMEKRFRNKFYKFVAEMQSNGTLTELPWQELGLGSIKEECLATWNDCEESKCWDLEVFENAREVARSNRVIAQPVPTTDELDDNNYASAPRIRKKTQNLELNANFRGGEMITCATDWLSEDRRQEYKIWKARMMRIIRDKLEV